MAPDRPGSMLMVSSSPLDLTKVRLQASGDKGMVQSLQKTIRTAGSYWFLTEFPVILIGPLTSLGLIRCQRVV